MWNGRGDLDRVEDVVTDDFVSHNPILAGPVRGPDGCRELPTMFRSLFADVEMEFGGVMAQNDRVPLGLTTHATSVEAFAGVAPTNQELAITGRCFERFVDGKIAARFSTTSRCRLPTSIGLIHRKEATPS